MFSLFNNLRRNHNNSLATRRSRRRVSRRGVLHVEGLEDRRMLSSLSSFPVGAEVKCVSADTNRSCAGRVCASDRSSCTLTFVGSCEQVVDRTPQDAPATASLLLTTEAATAELVEMATIDDCFANDVDLLAETSAATGDDSFEPLPAGFFEPGSEPFDGQVELGGTSGTNDTIVERMDSAFQLLDGPPETVPIEIVALSLVSVEPVVIPPFNGPIVLAGSEFFAFPGFTGGVSVATGDVNADGFDDVIVGTGVGTGDGLGVFNDPVPADNDAVFANPADTGNGGTASGTTLSTGTYAPESRYNEYIEELFDKLDYYREKIAASSLWERYLGEGSYDQENYDRTLAEIRSLLNGP